MNNKTYHFKMVGKREKDIGYYSPFVGHLLLQRLHKKIMAVEAGVVQVFYIGQVLYLVAGTKLIPLAPNEYAPNKNSGNKRK